MLMLLTFKKNNNICWHNFVEFCMTNIILGLSFCTTENVDMLVLEC